MEPTTRASLEGLSGDLTNLTAGGDMLVRANTESDQRAASAEGRARRWRWVITWSTTP